MNQRLIFGFVVVAILAVSDFDTRSGVAQVPNNKPDASVGDIDALIKSADQLLADPTNSGPKREANAREATKLYEQALQIKEKTAPDAQLTSILNNLAAAYLSQQAAYPTLVDKAASWGWQKFIRRKETMAKQEPF
jgi:hypothetical protein